MASQVKQPLGQESEFTPEELAIHAVNVMTSGTRQDKEKLVQTCLAAGQEFMGDMPNQEKDSK